MHSSKHDGWEAYLQTEAELNQRLAREGRAVAVFRPERWHLNGPAAIKRRRLKALLIAAGLVISVALFFALSGCGYGDEVTDAGSVSTLESAPATEDTTTSRTQQTTTTEAGNSTANGVNESLQVNVYFARADMIGTASRTVDYTRQTAEAALQELLAGPTEFETETAGMRSSIPEGTTLLGVDIDQDGTATVDLSKEFASGGGTLSMTMRLAQVVYTITQFPTVDRVGFMLDGEPVTVFGGEGILLEEPVDRDYFEDVTPAILIESPAVGQKITSPVRLTGTANVFEATFNVGVVNADGATLAEQPVTATSGTGTRGTFDTTLTFETQQPDPQTLGRIVAYSVSPRDGSQENAIEVPVQILKPE